jgi:nucleoside-diphosphate-sugar epimerase
MSLSAGKKVLVVGLGAVGSGIAAAFRNSTATAYDVTTMDPHAPDAKLQTGILEVPKEELCALLNGCVEIVYAAEPGNRDDYTTAGSTIARDNAARFASFVALVADCWPAASPMRPHVAYAGGSWTRREAVRVTESGAPLVDNESPAKTTSANAYEVAKSEAEAAAERLSALHRVSITFFDWISVVPNFAPNFTIAKMTEAALRHGKVEYSEGDYGRPLLHSEDAGHAVVLLAEERLKEAADQPTTFESVLVPGAFTPFREFARIVVEETKKVSGRSSILATPQTNPTPEFLRTRCSSRRMQDASFTPRADMIEAGLRETCRVAAERVEKEMLKESPEQGTSEGN